MNNLRPDEKSSQAEIERIRQSDANIKRGAQSAIGLATGAVGLGLSSKIMPFLNQYIPADLAMRGISKVSPKLGDFLKRGVSQGLDIQEGLNFLKDEFTPKEQKPVENKNVIAKYSDELHAFLENEIKNGRQPLEAGAIAQLNPKFKPIIKKLEDDNKAPFSSLLESVYGSSQQAGQQSSQSQAIQPQQQAQAQQTQQTQGSNGVDPNLLQLMQNMQSTIQKLRGG